MRSKLVREDNCSIQSAIGRRPKTKEGILAPYLVVWRAKRTVFKRSSNSFFSRSPTKAIGEAARPDEADGEAPAAGPKASQTEARD